MRTATSSLAQALFSETKLQLTSRLRELVRALAEAESDLDRSEPGERSSMLHHQVTELRLRVAALDTPLLIALRRLDNGKHKSHDEIGR